MAQTLLDQAREARNRLDWRAAALAFTAAADALPPDPHGNVTAEERSLRRNAHLALCRTEAFKQHRERQNSLKPRPDVSGEWMHPSGELVRRLLTAHARPAS